MASDSPGDEDVSAEILACILMILGDQGIYGSGMIQLRDLSDILSIDKNHTDRAAKQLDETYDWVQYSSGELSAPRKKAQEEAKSIRDEFWG